MPTRAPTRRKEERLPLSLSARLRTARGLAANGVLTNLSESGCSIHINAPFLETSSHVAVQMEGLSGIGGTVRWKEGNFIGVEFHSALYRAVVEHLAKTMPVKVTATGP